MEALPNPKTQDYRSSNLKLAYLYGAIQLSGQLFELAESNVQAFASVLDQEMEGIREGLKKDTNRQTYGTNTGILAVATGAGSTTTFVTTNAQYLEIGMFIDLYNSTDTNSANVLANANVQITNITVPQAFLLLRLVPRLLRQLPVSSLLVPVREARNAWF